MQQRQPAAAAIGQPEAVTTDRVWEVVAQAATSATAGPCYAGAR